ncbi:MAG: hypothetical protein JXA90_02200 [Planctomycetes bacterium]|nr:hypothetical protein [Planctomycetota bacterium]
MSALILLVLFVKPATVLGNGFERAAREILFCIAVIPLVLMGVAFVCAIRVSKSRFALLYYPAIGGVVAAARVPPLISAGLSAEAFFLAFFLYGIVYGLAGLGIGGMAFLIRAAVEQHTRKDKPPAGSRTSNLSRSP